MRPVRRPGLHLLRRDARTLQVGLEWPALVALTDSPVVRALLATVDGFLDAAGIRLAVGAAGFAAAEVDQAFEVLVESGVLIDQDPPRPPHTDEALWSAWALLAGPREGPDSVWRSRGATRAHVSGSGTLPRLVRTLLAGERVRHTADPGRADVVVVTSDADPPADVLDDAVRLGAPFLVVGVRELVGLVGPFVIPGETACPRCVDLTRAQLDRCWPTLVRAAQARPPAVPSGPPTLRALTAAYAAQEVALWASGTRPVSYDHVVEIPYGLGAVQTVPFPPHPECGCGWRLPRDKMSA